MIEAVNSVLANASLLRSSADSKSKSQNNIVETTSDSGSQPISAPYISPYVSVDINYNKAVLQLRDSVTGDVVEQIPDQRALESNRRDQVQDAAVQLQQTTRNVSDNSAESDIPEQKTAKAESNLKAEAAGYTSSGQGKNISDSETISIEV
jgi:hypothetical protein